MKKDLYFEWGSEKQIRIAQVGQRETFFYEAYRQALAGVTEIVRSSIIAVNGAGHDPFTSSECADSGRDSGSRSPDDRFFYNYPNNMLVFSGDRGAGKSSAMLSFVHNLKDPGSRLFDKSFLREMIARELPGVDYCSVSNMLHGTRFVSIPPIDPTTLENSDQILTVILARMFQLALDVWREGETMPPRAPKQERINRKNALMKQFSTCYEHIRAIKNQDDRDLGYEGLEVLADLRDNSRLKCEFADLVEELLKFKYIDSPGKSYLVIQIDDTDMNIQHAYSILEDIRKYLVIPQVIIVMAANLGHLKQVVESSLLGDYHDKLQKSPEYANHIAQQYITKLFPQTRQINLPDLGTYFKEHADGIKIHYHVTGQPILPDQEELYPDVQEQIFRLIYRKTGLIFLKDKNRLHDIIPTNMRLLAHFLAMLIQMEDVECPGGETPQFFLEASPDGNGLREHARKLRTRLDNILRFRDYFLSTWVTNNLNGKYAELISQLDRIDISRKVRFVCRHLWNLSARTLPQAEGMELELAEDQCSYANMILLCGYFETTSIEESDSRFIFAIHTYFSLLGHSIVLEELIDFYDQLNDPAVNGLRCPLSRLYPLYGSRLFPYSDRPDKMEQSSYCTQVSITNDAESRLPLISRWEGGASGVLKDFRLKDTISLLYSMFADYQPVEHGSELLLDLSSSIPNCLYLYKREYLEMSPLAKTMCVPANSLKIEDKDWLAMRNSALLTVLNWDVQNRVGRTLLSLARPAGSEEQQLKITYEEWAVRVKAFYDALSKPLHSPEGVTPAIAALNKIEFGGWFELPALSDGDPDGLNNVLDIQEWYDALYHLNPCIKRPDVQAPERPADGREGDQGGAAPSASEPEEGEAASALSASEPEEGAAVSASSASKPEEAERAPEQRLPLGFVKIDDLPRP